MTLSACATIILLGFCRF